MEKFYRFSVEKIEEALKALNNQYIDGRRGINILPDVYFTDGLDDTLSKVLDVFTSSEEFEDTVPKRKCENVQNFNGETLETLRPYFENPAVFVYGHGTTMEDSAKGIIDDGLKMKNPDILSTSIPINFSQKSFDTIKKWPHLGARYIVLFGIWDDIMIPCIKENEKSNGYNTPYLMDKSRIIGYIDSENESFVPSPYYKEVQEFNPEYPILPRMTYKSSAFQEISSLLECLKYFSENKGETEVSNNVGGIRSEMFKAIYDKVRYLIDEVRSIVKNSGITRDEYEKELERRRKENSQNSFDYEDFDDIELDDIKWDDIEWDEEITPIEKDNSEYDISEQGQEKSIEDDSLPQFHQMQDEFESVSASKNLMGKLNTQDIKEDEVLEEHRQVKF